MSKLRSFVELVFIPPRLIKIMTKEQIYNVIDNFTSDIKQRISECGDEADICSIASEYFHYFENRIMDQKLDIFFNAYVEADNYYSITDMMVYNYEKDGNKLNCEYNFQKDFKEEFNKRFGHRNY